jgi:hypothetical protein
MATNQSTGKSATPKTGNTKGRSGKPNILVIWGDDIGICNLSCYSRGSMSSVPGWSEADIRHQRLTGGSWPIGGIPGRRLRRFSDQRVSQAL